MPCNPPPLDQYELIFVTKHFDFIRFFFIDKCQLISWYRVRHKEGQICISSDAKIPQFHGIFAFRAVR
ncbi:hypothetical protein BvCmsHHNP007_02683 [Escherichia coli]|nr:hypothetical protein BvCmsC117A_01339 [Escherichia coli]GCQ55071.1 hypothetical protein BvCmsHHNP007_02683 [Escherichia coli]CTU12630.1 Uncharacterised protein [Escherichia coli]